MSQSEAKETAVRKNIRSNRGDMATNEFEIDVPEVKTCNQEEKKTRLQKQPPEGEGSDVHPAQSHRPGKRDGEGELEMSGSKLAAGWSRGRHRGCIPIQTLGPLLLVCLCTAGMSTLLH
ncbi:hypothetical protein J4Q44_G00103580 [Coregonus suidteri]|uniref:Uncharacterized protein n=1 Tax=Coregonus suidteri TaxID=861788 RepID=A0AAN8R9Y9_9TELE